MTVLLAIDPSVRSPGVAEFKDGVLCFAGRPKIPKQDHASEGARWDHVAEQIYLLHALHPTTIVYERPQVYRAAKSKGDPNDLIGLAAIGAAVAARFAFCSPEIITPTPAEWCGQIPKVTKGSAKKSPRALRILSRLSPDELKLVPDQHDIIDAVGIGLWALGRLGITRVYATGRAAP